MKYKSCKKIVAFLLCFVIITMSICVPVKADGLIWDTLLSEYKAMKEMSQWTLYDVFDMFHLGSYGLIPAPSQAVKDKFGSYYDDEVAELNNVDKSNVTNEMRLNYLHNCFTVNDNSITISDSLKSIITNWQNDIIDDTPFSYAYTFDINLYQFQFDNGVAYRELLSRGTNRELISVKNTGLSYFSTPQVYNLGFVKASVNSASNWIQVYPYNISTWEPYDFEWDRYEFVDNTYIKTGDNVSGPSLYLTIDETVAGSNMDFGLFSNGSIAYPVYDSLEDLRLDNDGVQDYYINDTVYNDWSTSSGDYTVSTSNYNPVTYGDVTNYVNSFNSEYGYNPNPSDIDYFIKNYDPNVTPTPTPTPNPNNPSSGGSSAQATANNEGINITINNNHSLNFGGSSLSGNTVSGNGVDGSGGNIFDFIGRLGSILGNLIKNLGNALVDLITGISETISSILSGLTNIFSGIIEFTFSGLPEDIRALLLLGLSVGLIVSVVKILRG